MGQVFSQIKNGPAIHWERVGFPITPAPGRKMACFLGKKTRKLMNVLIFSFSPLSNKRQ